MVAIEQTVPVLLIILFIGLMVPELFRKLKLPFVSGLIILGAVLGPFGTNYVQMNTILEFFGFLGSSFLMLMAGLEAKIKHLRELEHQIGIMAFFNSVIPFLAGVGITRLFGYDWMTCLLIGIVFISSSIAIIIPSMRSAKLLHRPIGESIVSAVMITDIISLLALAVLLQNLQPVTQFPLPIYFGILIFSVVVLKMFVPEVAAYFLSRKSGDNHESQLQFVLVLLMGVLFYFSTLGVHPILASFLVGLLLADVITSETLYHKLHTLAYGLFVPVFFFIIGMEMDLTIFMNLDFRNVLLVSIIGGLVGSKFLSGYFSARLVRFSQPHSTLFGVVSTTQLTTTLAATYAGSALGLLDTPLLTSIVLLSILTTIFIPITVGLLAETYKRRRHV